MTEGEGRAVVGGVRIRRGVVPLALAAGLLTGCGARQQGVEVQAYRPANPTPAVAPTPVVPSDFPCPGESPSWSTEPSAPSAQGSVPAAPPTDHYAENHGFDVPFPLHGQSRCDGLAAVRRIEAALEPLRRRGDFVPQSIRGALVSLGFPAGAVEAYQNGPTGISFLVTVDRAPVCVEGTIDRASTQADAFGGYPDHASCDRPTGGH